MRELPPMWHVDIVRVRDYTGSGEEGKVWVEIFMSVKHNGDACEPLFIEWYPRGHPEASDLNTRVMQPDIMPEKKLRKYELFAAIIGGLTYNGD